jgi:hypothetical protein
MTLQFLCMLVVHPRTVDAEFSVALLFGATEKQYCFSGIMVSLR